MTAADSDLRRQEVATSGATASAAGGRSRLVWAAMASSVVAVLCALALPFAPVSVSDPVVSWPEQPGQPESTSLLLNAYEPRELDVRFSCAAVRAAAATADGVVLATVQPATSAAERLGLVVTARDDRLRVVSTGTELLDAPLPTGQCTYALTGDAGGLVLTRDGGPVDGGAVTALPDVDALITSLEGGPGIGPGDLSATVRIADPFAHRPAAGKVALLVVMAVAAAVSLSTLAGLRRHRRSRSPEADRGTARTRPRPRVLDAVVIAVLVTWVFLAPSTDDDGYYSAMARNVDEQGYVAQYYQLRNQSFTPFTWFYYGLSAWQELGVSPTLLRVPALVAGLLTYALLRVFVAGWLARHPETAAAPGRRPGRGTIATAVLAVTFLAWWLPYSMGVRPESMVPVLSAGVLVAAGAAVRRGSLPLTALALALAAASCTVHPTGFVALGPLLVSTPGLWRVVRADAGALLTAARLGAVAAAPVALASALAFVDGTFYDFVRSQEIFLSIQEQNDWYDEITRYGLLLNQIPMGAYAKRAAVLFGLLCLVWFAVLAGAARARGVRVPPELRLAGWSLALGFVLLLVTPSKWTHHFGALAGLGPAFLTLFLLSLPWLARRVTGGQAPGVPVGLVAVGSVAAVGALSLHGPNDWPYSWMLGMPQAFETPSVGPVGLDSLLLWLLVGGAVTAALARAARRAPSWRPFAAVLAAPAVLLLVLVVVLGYLLGTFGYATAATWNSYSPQSAALRDPLARDCAAGGAVQVADDRTARPLPPVGQPGDAPEGDFAPDGWSELSPPPEAVAQAGVRGSLTGPGAPELDDDSPEATTGRSVSGWFELPATLPEDEALVVMAAGRLEGGNALEVEYGRTAEGGDVDVVLSRPLADGAVSSAWRSFPLRTGDQVPGTADVVRLVARDGSTGRGGWLAYSVPTVQRFVPLPELIGGAPTAVSWQFAFHFPCAAQPVVSDGITEPVQYGVLWGESGIEGLGDATFQESRGGLFGQLDRSAGAVRLLARVEDRPDVRLLQVYRFQQPLPLGGYELTTRRETVSGLTGPS